MAAPCNAGSPNPAPLGAGALFSGGGRRVRHEACPQNALGGSVAETRGQSMHVISYENFDFNMLQYGFLC